jgi:hypothetical protein
MSATFGSISLVSGTNDVAIRVRTGLAAGYTLALPNTAPGNSQTLVWNTTNSAFEWGVASLSLTTTDPTSISVTDTSGGAGTSYSVGFPSTVQSRFLASPSGGTGTPTFREIVDADITSLDSSKLTGTVAAARMPSGTNATSWQIGAASGNSKLVADTTSVTVRKADDSLADLVVNKITATQADFVNVTTIDIGDNILTLNADEAGTPTQDAGLEIERGTQENFQIIFQESTDRLVAGLVGALQPIARVVSTTFTSAELTGNDFVWIHNMETLLIGSVSLIGPTGRGYGVGWSTGGNPNQLTIDTQGLTITGTWTAVAIC